MGNCKPNSNRTLPRYSVTHILSTKNPRETLSIQLNPPFKQSTQSITLGQTRYIFSTCIFPAQDPRSSVQKACQDTLLISEKADTIMASLFDGHGVRGHEVSVFCENFIKSFFLDNTFDGSTNRTLEEMFLQCDEELIDSRINTDGSGTTALVMIITPQNVHIANVGDSRAVLGTLPKASIVVEKIKKHKGFGTEFLPSRGLEALQLTIDQKPNFEHEMSRIVKSGGIVSKALDKEGNPIGPYRVFHYGQETPGLAMSRSLGDLSAKKIGVIANPLIENFRLVARDQFIIIASDGLWDVFSNSEAVHFVETFRRDCCKQILETEKGVICTTKCTPARLLAEEARLRWLGLNKEEDIVIDDISVIIIELLSSEVSGFEETVIRSVSQDLGNLVEIQSDLIKKKNYNTRNTLIGNDD